MSLRHNVHHARLAPTAQSTFPPLRPFILTIARHFFRDPRLFLKYVTVGGASAVIELSLFSLFYSLLAWPLLVANSCALGLTLLFHFNMQKHWTFGDRQSLKRQIPRYVLMISIAAVLNNLLIYLFVAILGMHALIAKVLQIGLVFLFTFNFSRAIVFVQKPPG